MRIERISGAILILLSGVLLLMAAYGITRQAADKRLKKIEEKIKKLVAIF